MERGGLGRGFPDRRSIGVGRRDGIERDLGRRQGIERQKIHPGDRGHAALQRYLGPAAGRGGDHGG